MNEERRRFEDVFDPDMPQGPMKVHEYEEVPEIIVNWILHAVFPIQSELKLDQWGVPVLFKVMV